MGRVLKKSAILRVDEENRKLLEEQVDATTNSDVMLTVFLCSVRL